jgi:hypothetical protein
MESFTLLAEMISKREPELAARINPYIQEYIQQRVDVKFSELVSEGYTPHGEVGQLFDYEIRLEDDDENKEGSLPVNPIDPKPVTPTDNVAGPAAALGDDTNGSGQDIIATSSHETDVAVADRQYARIRPNPKPIPQKGTNNNNDLDNDDPANPVVPLSPTPAPPVLIAA